jgi:GAF domain-containing protein
MALDSPALALWTDDFSSLAFDHNRCPRPGEKLFALFRATRHLVRYKSDTDLMEAILSDTVAVLDARCGAIALADSDELLHVRAQVGSCNGKPSFSQKLAVRSFLTCKSILCGTVPEDARPQTAHSVSGAAMASVICVLLRTARGRLGVLQLGRNTDQPPFDKADLYFADAVAVYLSIGIEGAPLKKLNSDDTGLL